MMDGYDEEPPLFPFEDDNFNQSAMDMAADMDDDDADAYLADSAPPYGPMPVHRPASRPMQPAAGPGQGRLHLSSATIWQRPEHQSPPALSYSPSPRDTDDAPFQPRHDQLPPSHTRRPSRDDPGPAYHQQQQQLHHRHQQPPPSPLQRDGEQRQPRLSRAPSTSELSHQELQQVIADAQARQSRTRDFHASAEPVTPEPRDYAEGPSQPRAERPPKDYVMVPDEDVDVMFNGNEADRITAQKLRDQAYQAVMENGRVVWMVGKATAQWWNSSEMTRRRRRARQKAFDVAFAGLAGAGSVIMTSTPVGRMYDTVSANAQAFKASPWSYTLQSLNFTSQGTADAAPEPAIADDDDGMGHLADIHFDDDDLDMVIEDDLHGDP